MFEVEDDVQLFQNAESTGSKTWSTLFYFIIENVHLYFLEEGQNLIGLFVFSPEGASGITRLVRALWLLPEL